MKYLISPSEYPLPNPRIDGFRKLKEVNAKTVDISVFSLDAFKYFLDHKQLPKEFVSELKEASSHIIENTNTRAAVVRRAFVVPGLESPPGPYFLNLKTPESVVDAVKSLYEFAISQNYHTSENSQISGFLYPFIDPQKFNKANPNLNAIPYGGYAIIQNDEAEIYAVWGNNEGVQSLVADRYTVSIRGNKYLIQKKEVPQKNKMICATEDSPTDIINTPTEIQFDQVLSDNEVLEVARVLANLFIKYGPQRVEFTADQTGLIFNEVADYWKETKRVGNENIQVKGVVKIINSLDDFRKLAEVPKRELLEGKVIVEVGQKIITDRYYDVLGALAAWKDNLYVLYPGVAATQHAMRVLTDKGHKAFLIGNQKFDEGDKAQIVVTGGKVRVTNLSRTQNEKYISLWDASLLGVDLCGGKADRLSRLKLLGFQVPHGAILTTWLFDEIMKKLGYPPPASIKDFSNIYKLLDKPPEDIINEVNTLLANYIKSSKEFAVRSSATIEDDSQNSMAGMFDTFLNISGSDLPLKVLQVIQSAFSLKIVQYLKKNPELISKLKMAIAVQEMVPARCAGVIFGAKAQTGNLDIVEIEANKGLGEGIVSGKAKEVEQYKFSRSERRVIERKGPEFLSPSEAKALFMLSERLRSEFNDVPQDIEWAIDTKGQIWVLQSRDLYLKK